MLRIQTLGGLSVTRSAHDSAALLQPRRLAVLAAVARAGKRGITRDKLLALFWPAVDEDAGRKALSQGLYSLRRELGADELFEGMQELWLNPQVATCDVVEFDAAYATGDLERAASLYQGPFLDGFRVSGSPEFERWAEEERSALAHRHASVLEQLARQVAGRGEHGAAVTWWRRLAAQDPLNSRTAIELMEALLAAGDRNGALQHARIYEALVEQELELPPDREVVALAERIRRLPGPLVVVAAPAEPEAKPGDGADDGEGSAGGGRGDRDRGGGEPAPHETNPQPTGSMPTPVPAGRSRTRQAFTLTVLLLAAAGAAAVALRSSSPRVLQEERLVGAASGLVIAVGQIADYVGEESGGAALADMLATNLARTDGLRVISTPRLYSVLPPGTGSADFGQAARAAGANALIDGSLYRIGSGALRLDLRRIDLRSGVLLSALSLEAPDLFSLADEATARLTASLGLRAPVGSLASVTTHSAVAYRLYEAGLRTFYDGAYAAAASLFEAAVEEDSTFAMAAFYLAQSREQRDSELRSRLVRLAARAGGRERLTIRSYVAALEADPRLQAFADSLLLLYPDEVEGYLYTGIVRFQAGNYPAALRSLRRAVEMDSLSLKANRLPCNACAAMIRLIAAYQQSDSLAAAEREARWWIRIQPEAAEAWRHLAITLLYADRGDEALAAFERTATLNPRRTESWAYFADHTMRRGEFARADSVLLATIRGGSAEDRAHATSLLIFSLRNQGRLREALALARELRASAPPPPPGAAPLEVSHLAQVLFEQGRYREAAALLDSIARWTAPTEAQTFLAAHRAWYLALSATGVAYGGDAAALSVLADSVREIGARSARARSRVLHHYVRGLDLAAARRDTEALEELRRAVYSPNLGFTRANVEIARLLLRQGRGAEAIPLLQAALRGSPYSTSPYVTWTEIHEQLARAWQAAGRADSAAYHTERVIRAWQHADPELRPRRAEAEMRLAALRRGG
jgi:DNA-binding SARP family transcriptional activator